MHFNAKVALLLLGMLAGGVAGYLTRSPPVEIVRLGGPPPNDPGGGAIMPPLPQASAGHGLMSTDGGRILIFAAGGGVIGLLAGFAAGRL